MAATLRCISESKQAILMVRKQSWPNKHEQKVSISVMRSAYSSACIGTVGMQRCTRWMRAHRAGELSASVGRRALVRRLCDAQGNNIREFKSSLWTGGKVLRKTSSAQAPPLDSQVSNLKIVGASYSSSSNSSSRRSSARLFCFFVR